jgi:hypothetical protein
MQELMHYHRLDLSFGMGVGLEKVQIDKHAGLDFAGDGQRWNRIGVFDLQDLKCSPDCEGVFIDQFLQKGFKVSGLHW